MAKLNLSNIGPMDNRIINGDFDIWQRGTSFAPAVNGAFQTDRWEYQNGSDAVNSILQSTDVPTFAESGHTSKYSLKVDCTTADSAVAATDYVILIYRMEGLDVSPLIGKTITVSFWVKSTKTGGFTVCFYNNFTSEGYPIEYTISASDTWEKKTVSVLLPTTESWTTSNAVSLTVYFTIMGGSNFQMTPDTWNAGYALATSNQVNGMDNTANNFLLSQVKLEEGQIATPFISRPFAEELALCQRYYQKSYAPGIFAGASTSTGAMIAQPMGTLTRAVMTSALFPVQMRTTPTVVVYDQLGALDKVNDYNNSATTYTFSAFAGSTANMLGQYVVTTGNMTSGVEVIFHYTADAEL